MRVNEIFYSLQGEGAYTGRAAIFVRLSGCNLKCPFCDTNHQTYTEMTKEDILNELQKYDCKFIVFTGGEPTLQLDAETLNFFKRHKYFIQVETNGTGNLPVTLVDWVTCSPKDNFCSNAEIKQEKINEVKVVFDGNTDPAKYLDIQAEIYCLQPCDTGDEVRNKEIMQKCVDYILQHPKWCMSLQTQKILNVR